jgi:sigma-B regulation protein RsbU (phosphoserine phosphatase)
LRFYAGAPLRTDTGQPIGALCVVDFKPRTMSERERKLLKLVAEAVMMEVKLRKTSRQLLERTRTMERDLAAARIVQRFLLPSQKQEGEGFNFWHFYHPFDAIGGDFLDSHLRADGSLAALIADVSGHGASAALTSAMVKTVFQRAAVTASGPDALLSAIQLDLSRTTDTGQFITAAASVYDPASRRVHLASAGHPFPILLRGRKAEIVKTVNDLPLLIETEQTYGRKTTLELGPTDRLLFYTDGATEAGGAGGRMLGESGLVRLIESNASLTGGAMLHGLFQGIRSFAGGNLKDDVALVCLEVK